MKKTVILYDRHTIFKEYPRTYEYIFTHKGGIRGENRKNVDIYGISNEKYVNFIRNYAKYWDSALWAHICTVFWIESRFTMNKQRKNVTTYNALDLQWSLYHRTDTNIDPKSMTSSALITGLKTYVRKLYPDITNKKDISEFNFEFPFKNIGVSHMFLVHQLPERMELLQIAEDRNMQYWDFIEYIVNYISCYNHDYGKQYTLTDKANCTYYVSWKGYEAKP